jgi:hypothetical protein
MFTACPRGRREPKNDAQVVCRSVEHADLLPGGVVLDGESFGNSTIRHGAGKRLVMPRLRASVRSHAPTSACFARCLQRPQCAPRQALSATTAAIFKINPRAWELDAGLPANTFAIRIYDYSRSKSDARRFSAEDLPFFGLATTSERDLLSLVEAMHRCTFDRADVHKNILAAVIRLDESIALLAVEPLHDSFRHLLSQVHVQ